MVGVTITTLPVGFVLNQRYEVRGRLGGGANGVVYEVLDHRQNEVSALKLLLTAPVTVWDEAKVLTGLRGEFILPVRNADLASGVPFIVTEVAAHGTVAGAAVPGIGVPPDEAVRWIQQACRGTARIHDLGLLHNDLKPENLFLDGQRNALVGDLGLACLRDPAGFGHFGGTAQTMAPEVALIGATVPQTSWHLHRPTSVASDVYSLGSSLYWLLAGVPAHHDPGGGLATMAAVAAGGPRPLRDLAPHVSQGLAERVATAMHRNPGDRYQSPAAFDAALGSRPVQSHTWIRQAPHPGHTDCFLRKGPGANLGVCAIPGSSGTKHDLEIRYVNTGKRAGTDRKVPRRSALPQALRVAFRDYG